MSDKLGTVASLTVIFKSAWFLLMQHTERQSACKVFIQCENWEMAFKEKFSTISRQQLLVMCLKNILWCKAYLKVEGMYFSSIFFKIKLHGVRKASINTCTKLPALTWKVVQQFNSTQTKDKQNSLYSDNDHNKDILN